MARRDRAPPFEWPLPRRLRRSPIPPQATAERFEVFEKGERVGRAALPDRGDYEIASIFPLAGTGRMT